MRRCSGPRAALEAMTSRISSAVMTARPTCGSAPARRTSTLVDAESSQTAGRAKRARPLSGRAATVDQPTARCMAMRFGASSPKTSVKKARATVTTTTATGRAALPSRSRSGGMSGSARLTAATAEARNPAKVIPTWMVERNRVGSWASRAASAAAPPRCCMRSMARWVSEISASSAPAKRALMATSTTMTTSCSQTTFIRGCSSGGAHQPRIVVPSR